jgi:3-hydroxyisobutyrate dehydrogenase-like beta-hydroxyacid dehydrogenase
MVNQIALAGLLQGLAEALNFAQRAGLDASQVVTVLTYGAARSWQMENRGVTMIADRYDFGFAVDWMRKDLRICLAEAQRQGAALPVTAIVEQNYARLQGQGHGRLDASSLLKLLQSQQVVR